MLHKCIIFTKSPLLKAYKYRNRFQLVPIYYFHNAPFSKYATHFPAILEYETEEIEEDVVCEKELRNKGIPEDALKSSRTIPNQARVRKEILQLLSALTNFYFFEYHSEYGCWGIQAPTKNVNELNEKEILNCQISQWTIRNYVYPHCREDMKESKPIKCHEFYMSIDNDPMTYFTVNPNLENNPEIKIPPHLEFVLDRYYAMEDDRRKQVRQCMKLLNDGIDLFDTKNSVSLLSLISSIEGMALLDYSLYSNAENLGATKRFLRYLKTYVAGNSEEKFKQYYKRRCAISHEGIVFLGDDDFYGNIAEQNNDLKLRLEILQVARLALYNWLRRKE